MANEIKAKVGIDLKPFLKGLGTMTTESKETAKVVNDSFKFKVKIDDEELKDVEKKATKAGSKAGKNFGEGFYRDSRGRLKDANGKFIKDSVKAGAEAGKKTGKKFGSAFKSHVGNIGDVFAGTLLTKAFTGIISIARDATREFIELDKQIANIGTIVDDSVNKFKEFGPAVVELAKGLTDTPAVVAKGVYQAISAGITGTNKQILAFVETASKAGVAGLSNTEEAVNGLTSVINAYGLTADNAKEISSTFFATVKLGKVTFAELNAGLSNFVPIAAAMGVEFDQATAAIAQLTKQGTPTSKATTQMAGALALLQKGTPDLIKALASTGTTLAELRKRLKEPIKEGGGLVNVMRTIKTSAEKAGLQLAQVTGRKEAAFFIESLAGTQEQYNAALETTAKLQEEVQAGAAEKAFEVASQSIDVQLKSLKNNMLAVVGEILNSVMPAIIDVSKMLIDTFNQPEIKKGFKDIGKSIADSFKKLAPVFKIVLNGMIPLIKTISSVIGLLTDMAPVILPIVAAYIAYQGALKIARLAQLAMSAAMLAPPSIGLVIAGIVGLVAITKALRGALHETVEEKLEDTQASIELTKQEKNLNQEQQSHLKTQNTLIEQYKELAKKVKEGTAEETELEEITRKLRKEYPEAIAGTKDWADNLERLKRIADENGKSLAELEKRMKSLTREQKRLFKAEVSLNVDKAKGDLENFLTDATNNAKGFIEDVTGLLNFNEALLGSSIERKDVEDFLDPFLQVMYKASTSTELFTAREKLEDAMRARYKEIGIGIEDQIKIGATVDVLFANMKKKITSYGTGLKEVKKDTDKLTDAQKDALKLAEEEKTKAESTAKIRVKSTEEQLEAYKLLKDGLELYEKSIQEKITGLQESEQKARIKNLIKSLKEQRNAIKKDAKLSEEQRIDLTFTIDKELLQQEQEIKNKLLDETYEKEKQKQIELGKILIDKAKEFPELQLKAREDMNKVLSALEQDYLTKKHNLELTSIKELNLLRILWNKETWDAVLVDTKIALQTELALTDELTDKQIAKRKELQKALLDVDYADLIDQNPLEMTQADLVRYKEYQAKLYQIDVTYQEEKIKLISDGAIQTRETVLLQARILRDAEIVLAGESVDGRLRAESRFALESGKIKEQFLKDTNTLYNAVQGFSKALSEGFVFEDTGSDEATKRRIEALDEERQALKESLKAGKIDREKYAKAIAEINKESADLENDNFKKKIDFQKSLLKGMEGAFKSLAEISQKMMKSSIESMQISLLALQDTTKLSTEEVKNHTESVYAGFTNIAVLAGATLGQAFGSMISEGSANFGDYMKQIAITLLDTATAMMAAYIPLIIAGKTVEIPFIGTGIGIATAAGLMALLGIARGLVASLDEGEVNIGLKGNKSGIDTIPAMLTVGESVLTKQATISNKEAFEWANKTGKPLTEYFDNGTIINNYYNQIQYDNKSILDVAKLLKTQDRRIDRVERNDKIKIEYNTKFEGKFNNPKITGTVIEWVSNKIKKTKLSRF